MAFQWAGAAAGANDKLQEMLAQRMLEQYRQATMQQQQQQIDQRSQEEANQNARAAEQMALQRRGFEADEAHRTSQTARQGRMDDVEAADRRQTQNKAGVRSMVLEGLRAKTTDPRTAQLMAAGEGVDIDPDVLDPEKAQRDRLAQIQEQGKQSRMTAGARDSAASDQQWVMRGGQVVPIQKGTAQPGDTPYDPVAARSSQPVNKDEAVDTAREVKRIAGALRAHPGLNGAFGVVSSRMPTVMQSTADAETLLSSLQGLLTIENMGKMKGVLSDADMRILRQASTTLDAKMSEPAARAELTRLEQVMSKLVGDGPTDNTDDALLDELLGGGW